MSKKSEKLIILKVNIEAVSISFVIFLLIGT